MHGHTDPRACEQPQRPLIENAGGRERLDMRRIEDGHVRALAILDSREHRVR